MGRKKASRLLGLVGGLGALLLGAVVLGGATQAAAQAKPAAVPSGFAGAETCRSCHEDQFTKFEKTKMGRLFLRNARNTKESLGCESCHGSGKARDAALFFPEFRHQEDQDGVDLQPAEQHAEGEDPFAQRRHFSVG